ncbi:MAG: sugar ABC transporter permease [Ruminococcus sp.]|jgi:raffinose/stachyose/melibiose transport system permease protein|nr:sugar ABC transporter permease [Ruminococcus sp.]
MEKAIRRFAPVFILPMLIAFVIGFIVPFILGLWLSFCEFTTVSDATFVGFRNYIRAFDDETTFYSLFFTALFAIVSLVFTNIFAFVLAYFLTKKLKGTNIFRTAFFMPNLIGGIVLGYIWQLIINGILAHFDAAINLNAAYGFWGLVVLVCWQQIGYMMIIYIAGLGDIPPELNEAASIDGASGKDRLLNVTLPMLRPSITICTFLSITNGFKLFDQNLSLTAGEPSHATEMLALNIFNTFYSRTGFEGVGQAKAVMFFILVTAIGLMQLKFTSEKEEQA